MVVLYSSGIVFVSDACVCVCVCVCVCIVGVYMYISFPTQKWDESVTQGASVLIMSSE